MSLNRIMIQRTVEGRVKVRPSTAKVFLDRTVTGRIRIKDSARRIVVSQPQNVTVNLRTAAREVLVVKPSLGRIAPIVVRGGVGREGPQGPPGPPGSGSVNNFPTDNVVGGLRLVVDTGDGTGPQHADITDIIHGDNILGISLNSAVNPGEIVGVQVSGPVSNSGFNFVPGLPVFAGPDGVLTQNSAEIPGRAWQVIVGHATDSTTLFVNQQDPTFLC